MIYDKVYFIGTGKVGSECLKILSLNVDINRLYCLSIEEEVIPIIKKQCERLNIKNIVMSKDELFDYMISCDEKSLVISAHNKYIFPKEIIEKDNITIINFHNAYLPDYRGRNAPTWEIYNQEQYGGATWHLVDSTIDTGSILIQEKVPICSKDTALKLLMNSALVGIKLFRNNINDFLNGTYKILPQKNMGRLYFSNEIPNNGFFDLSWNYDQACSFLRAMDYKGMEIMPVPLIKMNGQIFKIVEYFIGNNDEFNDRYMKIEYQFNSVDKYIYLKLL